jgi:cell division transport system permease protein
VSAKRKLDSKAFAKQKQGRRKWLTFIRMCRYGVNNFSRNAWLTIAATAVMTITLLIIFTAVTARSVLVTTIDQVRDQVDMSIYLKTDTSQDDVNTLTTQIKELSSVKSVNFISPAQARTQFANDNKYDINILNALNQATNKFPATLKIKIRDINNTTQLQDFVKTNDLVKKDIDPTQPPSFAGDSKAAIETIGRSVSFAEQAGIIAGLIFVAISSLIIFNTIRMAIFNRKEEIDMMKLIGADKSFIRGPFVVEAIVYGFVAAVLATGIGLAGLYAAAPTLKQYVVIQPTLDFMTFYIAFVLLGMIVIGAFIGIVSSLLATSRYLKL